MLVPIPTSLSLKIDLSRTVNIYRVDWPSIHPGRDPHASDPVIVDSPASTLPVERDRQSVPTRRGWDTFLARMIPAVATIYRVFPWLMLT